MPKATVRLVTVARKKEVHRSIAAFQDELLNNLGWNGSVDYFICGANNDTTKLQDAANDAVTDAKSAVQAGQRAVIVAGGLQATMLLQNAVQASGVVIPIIQATGDAPDPTQIQNYVTGYQMDALGTAKYHLDKVNSQTVTVLYDDTPGSTSLKLYNALVTYNQTAPLPHVAKAITPLPADTPRSLKTRPYSINDRFHADPKCNVL